MTDDIDLPAAPVDDYTLAFTEPGQPPAVLYLRSTEYVAAVLAQALRDTGFTDVVLLCNEVKAKKITKIPAKKTPVDDDSATKSKTA